MAANFHSGRSPHIDAILEHRSDLLCRIKGISMRPYEETLCNMAALSGRTVPQPLANYRLKLTLADGEVLLFDMSPYLDKGVFTELKDEAYFRKARVAFGAVSWPNEQDLSHDTLYLLGTPV